MNSKLEYFQDFCLPQCINHSDHHPGAVRFYSFKSNYFLLNYKNQTYIFRSKSIEEFLRNRLVVAKKIIHKSVVIGKNICVTNSKILKDVVKELNTTQKLVKDIKKKYGKQKKVN